MKNKITGDGVRQLLDSCFTAKKITETLPPLPQGMKPRYNHVLHTVYRLQEQTGCRVSEVSRALNTTMPSITKLISELSEKGFLEKIPDPADGRVVLVRLTAKGTEYVRKYVLDYHQRWAEQMPDLTEDQIKNAIFVITALRDAMPDQI